jgi:hypothetical protein
MKIKEQTIKEMETLGPADLHIVYDLIQSMKIKQKERRVGKTGQAYQKVRNLLKHCKGSMSDDILIGRIDRV